MEQFPPLGPSASPDVLKSYSATLQQGDDQWKEVRHNKSKRSPNRNRGPPGGTSGVTQASQQLRGVRNEKTVTIYARNIAKDEQESDDAVKARVRRYVKRKRDVRIVSIQVVHNKYCEDSVGCKLCVPARFNEILISPGFWPDDVECREWSRRPPGGRYQRGRRRDADAQTNRYEDEGREGQLDELLQENWDCNSSDQDTRYREWGENGDVQEHRPEY